MKKSLLTLALASAFISSNALAEIHFSGFASIVAGTTGGSDEIVEGFENYAGKLDFRQESVLGLQASSDLGNGLGVTVQITARGIEDWDPQFEWAYVSYDVNDELRILAGRQRAPFFMYSDFLDVSYAYPWITPQQGVYDLVFDSIDGVGAIYNTTFGNVDATFHGIYGSNSEEFDIDGTDVTPSFDDVVGLATTFSYEWLTLRAAYFEAGLDIPVDGFANLATGFSATFAGAQGVGLDSIIFPEFNLDDVTDQLTVEDDKATFLEFGFQLNFDKLRVIGEYTELSIDDTPFADDEESYYVTVAYPVGDVLLHVTYGADRNTRDSIALGVNPDGTNIIRQTGAADASPALAGLLVNIDNLISGTNDFTASEDIDTSYVTLGARYDFHESAAVKLEYTNFSSDDANTVNADIIRFALVTVF